MVDHLVAALAGVRILSAMLALVLVLLAHKAWRGSRDRRMFRLGLGFALLLLSLLVEGAVFEVLFPGDLLTSHLVEAGTQLAAMTVLIWALF